MTNKRGTTDLEPANVCLCQIPKKFFVTDALGNNNQGLLHENTTLISDKLQQGAKKAGLYIKANADPFVRTVSLCPNEDGNAKIDDSLLRKVMQAQPLTVNRLNLCIDQPAKLTKTVMDTVF